MIFAPFTIYYNTLLNEAERTNDKAAKSALYRISEVLLGEEPGDIEISGTAYAMKLPPTNVPYGSTTARLYDSSLEVGEVDIDQVSLDNQTIDLTPEFIKVLAPLHKLIVGYIDNNQSDFKFKEDLDDGPYDSYPDPGYDSYAD